jgi:hypothetical protein
MIGCYIRLKLKHKNRVQWLVSDLVHIKDYILYVQLRKKEEAR